MPPLPALPPPSPPPAPYVLLDYTWHYIHRAWHLFSHVWSILRVVSSRHAPVPKFDLSVLRCAAQMGLRMSAEVTRRDVSLAGELSPWLYFCFAHPQSDSAAAARRLLGHAARLWLTIYGWAYRCCRCGLRRCCPRQRAAPPWPEEADPQEGGRRPHAGQEFRPCGE